jgi:hypothetical protein
MYLSSSLTGYALILLPHQTAAEFFLQRQLRHNSASPTVTMPAFLGEPCGPAPSDGLEFDTFDDAFDFCKQHTLLNGYSLVIHKRYPSASNFRTFALRCTRGRQYEADENLDETRETQRQDANNRVPDARLRMPHSRRQVEARHEE